MNHETSVMSQVRPLPFFISAYAPTLTATEDEKEALYENLNSVIQSVPYKHKLFILGDFNTRVLRDFSTWPKVLGHHSLCNENPNDLCDLITGL